MITFLLVRHGATEAVGRILAGSQTGWPLNSSGKRQVEELGARLTAIKVDAVHTSPAARTRETAKALAAPHGLQPQDEQALREMDFGGWEGETLIRLESDAEWRRFNQHRDRIRPPGGELLSEVQSRMVDFAAQLQQRHSEAIVVVVSHAEPLRLLIGHWLQIPLNYLPRLTLDPASVSVAKVWKDWAEVTCVNVKGELVL